MRSYLLELKEMLFMDQVTIDSVRYNKILFSGSSCTGKTTLIKAMKEDPLFKDWDYYTNVARNLHKEGREICEKSCFETQKLIFEGYSNILTKMEESLSISDRSIVDVLAFTRLLVDQMPIGNGDFMDMKREEMMQSREVSQRRDELSLLVYTPIEFPVEDDGERLVDEFLRDQFDKKIRQVLEENDIQYLVVTGTVKQRLEQIKTVVSF